MRPGAYVEPLAAGLTDIGQFAMSERVQNRELKLAIAGSIHGVPVQAHLTNTFVEALKAARKRHDKDVCDHYIGKLQDKSVLPTLGRT